MLAAEYVCRLLTRIKSICYTASVKAEKKRTILVK